jgi:predicted DNA-binding protein with PD1-like motif
MKSKLLDQRDRQRTFVVVFDVGDEVVAGLLAFAKEHSLKGSHLTAIGALQDVVLGYWDWTTKQYQRIPLREQVEVVSLVGNIAMGPEGAPKIHAHIVVSKSDGTAHGGHLLEAHVRPTLEAVLVESPEHLQRSMDPRTGLALLNL